jgi:hypothetical protein
MGFFPRGLTAPLALWLKGRTAHGQPLSNYMLTENFHPSVYTHSTHLPKLLSKHEEKDILSRLHILPFP